VGNLFSIKRVAPQDAVAPIAPPTIAFPTKIAPPAISGAILTSGVEEKEISETILCILNIYFFCKLTNIC